LCILVDPIRTRAEKVAVISPDAPPPVVLFSEQEEEYYGERVRGDDRLRNGFLECGVTTDTVPLQTDDSGLYLAYGYTAPGVRQGGSAAPWPNAEIRTYWHQDGTFVGGGNFNVPLKHADHDLWYTIDFESEMVSIFAGQDGFDDGEEARLGRYEHGMTDIASKGAVFLKLSGSNIRVHEVSLIRREN
jgi:hypothetical protein